MKKKYGKEFYLRRFQEAVCFLTALDIRNRFGTVAKASPAKKAYCLGFRADLAKKLSMIGPDKRAFN